MSARRCSTCSLNYPNTMTYKECLECGGETWSGQNVVSMPDSELVALKARVKAENEAIAKRPEGLGEQWLVVYTNREGQNPNGGERHHDRTETFFSTAYDVEEAKRQMDVCKSVHGVDVDVRTFVATARIPRDGGEVAAGTRRA